MMILESRTAEAEGETPKALTSHTHVLVQVDIADMESASVEIYARLDDIMPWVLLETYTGNTIEAILAAPFLRAKLAAVDTTGADPESMVRVLVRDVGPRTGRRGV